MPGRRVPDSAPGAAGRLPGHVRHLASAGALCWLVFLLAAGLSSSVNDFGAAVLLLLLTGGVLLLGGALLGWVLLHHEAARTASPVDRGDDFYRAD